MAAVEPVSLTIGAVALASLFSTCIECFEYFKAGKDLEDDLEVLLVKLDVEKARLVIWGNAVGVLQAENEGRATDLSNPRTTELVERCLNQIVSLLSDADKLRDAYGLQVTGTEQGALTRSNIVSGNSMNIFKTSYRRFAVRFASGQPRSGLLTRTKWAILDKGKFEGLILHLRDFINGLHGVISVQRAKQDQVLCDDIASIVDLVKLRLIRRACEGSYQTLSAAASAVIEASEVGTVDRRNIEEWMIDAVSIIEDDADGVKEGENNTQRGQVKLFETLPSISDRSGGIYFVLTGQCMNSKSSLPCDITKLGKECTKLTNEVIAEKEFSNWTVLDRISASINPKFFTAIDLDALPTSNNFELTDLYETLLPLASIYLYCAPCACLLATAFSMWRTAGRWVQSYFKFVIRPDHRLRSSCCLEVDGTIGYVSLLEEIRRLENTNQNPQNRLLMALDRLWIEQRLFETEEEGSTHFHKNTLELARELFVSHESNYQDRSPYRCAGLIILGELDHTLSIMQSPPFPSRPRIPRETEIFHMAKLFRSATLFDRKYLGTYTPKYRLPTIKGGRESE